MKNPKAWTVQKANVLTVGALNEILDHISDATYEWYSEVIENYCHVTYNNPDEYGDRPCTFAFPVIGKLGNDELELLTIIDGMIAETIMNSKYETYDDMGELYTYIDDEADWSACVNPMLVGIDKALRHVINANPNLRGECNG